MNSVDKRKFTRELSIAFIQMSRTLCCCCFSNNVRHLIFILSVLCASTLLSNILLFNAAVLHNSKDFQLVSSDLESCASSQNYVRRIRRDENANSANELTTTIDFDVNETTTQQIVDEVLRNEPESPQREVVVDNSDDQRAISSEIMNNTTTENLLNRKQDEPSMSSPSNSSALSFVDSSQPSGSPSSIDVSYSDNDSIENAQSPFTTVSDVQSFEKNQKIAGIMGSSLEKKIALALLWISPGIGTFLGTLPSIWFLRAIGERYLFAGSLFLSAVATSLMAFMLDDEWNQLAIAALRFVQGVAFSSAFPIMGSVSANWGTLKEQFLLLACSIFFIESTPALSWPICARFIEYDYKLPYFIHSTATFIFAFIWAVFYRNRPQYHPWVNGLELNKIVSGKVGAFNNRALEDQPFHVLLKSVPVWAIWMASFGFFIISTLLSQFLPTYFSIVIQEQSPSSIRLAAIPFYFVFIYVLLHAVWNCLPRVCGEWLLVLLSNSLSFVACALILIIFAIFPLKGHDILRAVSVFSILIICITFSVYGFGRSAVLVGRYFTQYIIANLQLFMGLAMMITSAIPVLTVQNCSPTEWRPTVLVCAALLLICATIFGFLADVKAEKWAKQSWDPSAARRMINAEQIDYHYDECGIIEMRSLSQ